MLLEVYKLTLLYAHERVYHFYRIIGAARIMRLKYQEIGYMPEIISFTPSLLESHCIIDVRTPSEFDEDHLPGACNIPLLTNEERVEIGIIHKNEGPQAARMRGLELTCSRFGTMVKEIASCATGRPILVYCWRGGMRSRSVVVLLEATGYYATQLKGGYKAFREQVSEYFRQFVSPAPLLVFHGMTGVGKTTFINSLDPDRFTVIDLEGLARHRGSAFGAVGLGTPPSQKKFETSLWNQFRLAPKERPIILEGESPRIGSVSLPGNIYDVMANSIRIWCTASLEVRIQRLAVEYGHKEYQNAMADSLFRIKKKLGGLRHAELAAMLDAWDIEGLARELIIHYYDKLYYRDRTWLPHAELSLEEPEKAKDDLLALLKCLSHHD